MVHARLRSNLSSVFSRITYISRIQWIELRSTDGDILFYYDPETREIWSGDPGGDSDLQMDITEDWRQEENPVVNDAMPQLPPIDDFGDDDINAADRLTRVVGYVSPFDAFIAS